jgi:quercetin 2,3-dioxygenase
MTSLARRQLLQGALALGVPLAFGGVVFASGTARKARTSRTVTGLVPGAPHTDGAGVRLTKLLGGQALRSLDPFLMLDAFGSDDPADYVAGFPKHPHRGFETVTILLDGTVEHRDSVGNHGTLVPGGIQWMTAGRGIVHEEMPRGDANGRNRGLQLWVNLPAAHKWDAPRYQDVPAGQVPSVQVADAAVRVLAGRSGSEEGPVSGVVVRPLVLDVTVPAGGRFETPLDGAHTAFVAGIEGEVRVGPDRRAVPAHTLAVLSPGDLVEATGAGRFLLVAGAPIGEPVARRGPFVMNTDAEIEQAYADYRAGRLGT